MQLLQINESVAIFQNLDVVFVYSDPYKNTFGESNWIIIILVLILCFVIIIGMILGTIHVQFLESGNQSEGQGKAINNGLCPTGINEPLCHLPQGEEQQQ